MKLKQTVIRAGFALALALPLLTSFSPTPDSAIGSRFELGGTTAWAQSGPSSAQPTPGAASSQSVGGTGSSSASSVRTGANVVAVTQTPTPAAAQPSGGSTVTTQSDGFQIETAPDGKPARAGSLIVTFKPGVQAASRDTAHREQQAQAVEPIGGT